jgi:hypothetical protein
MSQHVPMEVESLISCTRNGPPTIHFGSGGTNTGVVANGNVVKPKVQCRQAVPNTAQVTFCYVPRARQYGFSFRVRRQISLSISLHCLRVTPQATLTPAGTSKPRDTQSETHNSSERLPLTFPHRYASRTYMAHTHTVWHTHIETRGKAILHVT